MSCKKCYRCSQCEAIDYLNRKWGIEWGELRSLAIALRQFQDHGGSGIGWVESGTIDYILEHHVGEHAGHTMKGLLNSVKQLIATIESAADALDELTGFDSKTRYEEDGMEAYLHDR